MASVIYCGCHSLLMSMELTWTFQGCHFVVSAHIRMISSPSPKSLDLKFGNTTQYALTPRRFGSPYAAQSNYSPSPVCCEEDQSQPDMLLQLSEWEGELYNQDPSTCIHDHVEWRVAV